MYVCVPHMLLVPVEVRKADGAPATGVLDGPEAAMWLLGMEPTLSRRLANAFNG